MNDYHCFVKKHIPYSSIINREVDLGVLYKKIVELNAYVEIFSKHTKNQGDSANIFLNRFHRQSNKILLYIPLNDDSTINFGMRSIIECFLKYLYSIYYNNYGFEKINKSSFRYIKEDILKYSGSFYFNKDAVDQLLSYYSNYSNCIHQKTATGEVTTEYLEQLICNVSTDINKLCSDLSAVVDVYVLLTINIFNITEKQLNSADKVKISQRISSKRYKKFLEKLCK